MSRPAAERREELVALYHEARECTLCPLHESRTQVVFGAGNADADLMFVGEAPGFHEDQQGIPFVGRAGKLLDELLARSRGWPGTRCSSRTCSRAGPRTTATPSPTRSRPAAPTCSARWS